MLTRFTCSDSELAEHLLSKGLQLIEQRRYPRTWVFGHAPTDAVDVMKTVTAFYGKRSGRRIAMTRSARRSESTVVRTPEQLLAALTGAA